jgi:hypothetical protein
MDRPLPWRAVALAKEAPDDVNYNAPFGGISTITLEERDPPTRGRLRSIAPAFAPP